MCMWHTHRSLCSMYPASMPGRHNHPAVPPPQVSTVTNSSQHVSNPNQTYNTCNLILTHTDRPTQPGPNLPNARGPPYD